MFVISSAQLFIFCCCFLLALSRDVTRGILCRTGILIYTPELQRQRDVRTGRETDGQYLRNVNAYCILWIRMQDMSSHQEVTICNPNAYPPKSKLPHISPHMRWWGRLLPDIALYTLVAFSLVYGWFLHMYRHHLSQRCRILKWIRTICLAFCIYFWKA